MSGVPHLEDSRYPRRSGHRIAPWIDGIPFYNRLAEVFSTAQHRLWGGISFIQPGFVFPDGEDLWSKVEACARRDVDVRLLFWHNPDFPTPHIFLGNAENRAWLSQHTPNIYVRWDRSPTRWHCHHQKMWVVDAFGFVGGMVLSTTTLETPQHNQHRKGKHDVFLELEGPAVVDVAENFIQRWNASQDPMPWPMSQPDIEPLIAPLELGAIDVQITRTVAPGLYGQTEGESEILEQYLEAFDAATQTIYIESQHPGEEELLRALERALERGVRVVYIVPAEPMTAIRYERHAAAQHLAGKGPKTRYFETFARFDALARFDHYTLAALAGEQGEIYCHAKLCVVDGVWATVGSANLVDLSLNADHTELNASFWDPEAAHALLRELVEEHLGLVLDGLDDKALLERFAAQAEANQERRERGESMHGHAYRLDPEGYAQ